MSYEFTKLSDVTLVNTPASSANVLIEENGTVKKVPKAEVGTKLSDATLVGTPASNANVLIEESGVLKKVPKAEIGAQADWNETDETSPAFILNKPEFGGGSKVTYLFAKSAGCLYQGAEYDTLFDIANPDTPLTFQGVKNAFGSGVVMFCSNNERLDGSAASSIVYYSVSTTEPRIFLAYYAESLNSWWPSGTQTMLSDYTYVQPEGTSDGGASTGGGTFSGT